LPSLTTSIERIGHEAVNGESQHPGSVARRPAQDREFFETDVRLVAKLLEEGRKDGLRFDEGPSTARALLLATSAFIPYSLSVDDMGGIEVIERDLRTTVNLLVKGLRQPS